MTDREQLIHDAADAYAMEFLSLEQEAGMIKGKRLRGSQEKRMRRYVTRKLREHTLESGEQFGSIELWLFLIVNLAKVLYAAWKVWQDRHGWESLGHA